MRIIGLALLACLATVTAATAKPDVRPFVPVFETDFPDAFVLPDHGSFVAYATNARGGRANVQVARSSNLTDWALVRDGTKLHDAMPILPPWARPGYTWAPEVLKTAQGYVLHFTAKDRKSGLQCLGTASGTNALGPFTSVATAPMLCQTKQGGTIDSSPFRDADGQLYLYYKNDGNNPSFSIKTGIYGQRLASDGTTLIGEPVLLVTNDAAWEAHVIEAPTMVRRPGGYSLFFSANHFGWERDQRLSVYAIGYAQCAGPLGPCTDAKENPLLHSYKDGKAGCLSGPGHQSVFDAAGRAFIVFHAFASTAGCETANKGRYLYIAPLWWHDGGPVIGNSLRH